MSLFRYQKQVFEALQKGQKVILQAPTGSGKTRAGTYPFLYAWVEPELIDLPRQCIYSVPLQTLARQFKHEYTHIVRAQRNASSPLRNLKHVAFQTGDNPGDPKFEADLLFTTIDQTLSGFLSIPYGLSKALANFNAGAVIGSYLVFDEYHLFPLNKSGGGALTTTLHMLQLLRDITPWTLMTATFSRTLLRGLCERLGATEVSLDTSDFSDIPSQQGKQRFFTIREEPLTPEHVWDDMREHNRQRALVICNTVERAMTIAQKLRDLTPDDVSVIVFYNRFFQQDRERIEQRLAQEFGEDKSKYSLQRMILVATQIVEVGLNITSPVLHTDLAPASSIIQRAGRVARFAGETGQVYIYDVPRTKNGAPDYAPYFEQQDVCALSWKSFQQYSGQSLDYATELAIVDYAHHAFDQRLLDQFQEQVPEQRRLIKDAWTQCRRDLAPKLIREIDNVTLLIHPNPTRETLPHPYEYQGISMRRSILKKAWSYLRDTGGELEWLLAIPHEKNVDTQAFGQSPNPPYSWEHRLDAQATVADIDGVDLLAINPALISYDHVLGLRFEPGKDLHLISPAQKANTERKPKRGADIYTYETYQEHIKKMLFVYQRDLAYQGVHIRRSFERLLTLPQGSLEQALRLLFAIHDVGKLSEGWQRWAHAWQSAVRSLNPHASSSSTHDAIAHTDLDRRDSQQRQLHKTITATIGRCPNHAAESALVCLPLIRHVALQQAAENVYAAEILSNAMVSAVVRHHHALTEGNATAFQGYPVTNQSHTDRQALSAALQAVFLDDLSTIPLIWTPPQTMLADAMVKPHESEMATLLYLFLVRLLRHADQLALQEESWEDD
ncbi:CRISPR-associated helicase Cas3' [Dictyobacter formicarum]|uniref:CRISPR-associated helicase/endonuclease Cas3 n=1 Tax=Dictyobacter formicarum TaxID=2778368 RepID=A0ABQ3VT17_9CHLR|nr:CRISPR-associated helicase Cas3' [Dictyobacter formicarum]GHO88881.1 CRISPR-associated helicase/endonuclease Cas3 [Dictyobacter formicarum]